MLRTCTTEQSDRTSLRRSRHLHTHPLPIPWYISTDPTNNPPLRCLPHSHPCTHVHLHPTTPQYDGSWPDYLVLRNKLFGVSGQRGKYPQCFISRGSTVDSEEYEFVGMWEDVETLVESDSIPQEFLQAHPEIKTFSRVFADVKRI